MDSILCYTSGLRYLDDDFFTVSFLNFVCDSDWHDFGVYSERCDFLIEC